MPYYISNVKCVNSLPPVPPQVSLWTMRSSGLPVDLSPVMMDACETVLEKLLGKEEYEVYKRNGWLEMPTLR